MLLDPLRNYLDKIESAVRNLPGAYAEHYEEEILAADRAMSEFVFVFGRVSYWN